MADIDGERDGVADFIDVQALGTRIRLDLAPGTDADRAAAIRDAWSGCLAVGDGAPDARLTVSATGDLDVLLQSLSTQVTLEAITYLRGRALMFHAAGVAMDDGRVVAFVGPSGRGKTTLVRELARRFGYVSDETVAIVADGTVLPYRKPLSVVRAGAPKEQVSPDRAGLRDLPDAPLTLAALVVLDRHGEDRAAVVDAISFDDAVRELVPQVSYFGDLPHPIATLAGLCARTGGVRRLTYSRVDDAEGLLDGILAARAQATVRTLQPSNARTDAVDPAVRSDADATEPATREDAGAAEQAVGEDAGAAELAIGEDVDGAEVDGILTVYAANAVHTLGGIAPAIWAGVRSGLTRAQLVQDVVAEHGAPPSGDAAALVDAAVDELVGAGVLRRV